MKKLAILMILALVFSLSFVFAAEATGTENAVLATYLSNETEGNENTDPIPEATPSEDNPETLTTGTGDELQTTTTEGEETTQESGNQKSTILGAIIAIIIVIIVVGLAALVQKN